MFYTKSPTVTGSGSAEGLSPFLERELAAYGPGEAWRAVLLPRAISPTQRIGAFYVAHAWAGAVWGAREKKRPPVVTRTGAPTCCTAT